MSKQKADPEAYSTSATAELKSSGLAPASHDLERFVLAQDSVWNQVVDELECGAKQTHWMWFVFPQMRGLGHGETARRFGIASLEEASAYLAHPLLGPRLVRCCRILERLGDRSALNIFGSVDESKLRSCLTLFERVAPEEPGFTHLLEKYFGGQRDAVTLTVLGDVRSG